MESLVAFTARSFRTNFPVPFGASIYHTKTGELLLQATNAVGKENDPSAHAELRAIRLATKKRKDLSLKGYTLYSTCEPCPMCMSMALWAGLDRVVYGASIEDATKHFDQIHIPASEVASRATMRCKVEGPVLQEHCYNSLFTHPAFRKSGKKR